MVHNPFISITLSKPLMSPGSWLTLHNNDKFFFSSVIYDLVSTNLVSSGSIFTQCQGRGLTANLLTHLFYPGQYLPRGLVLQYLLRGLGGGGLQLIFQPIYFIQPGSLLTLERLSRVKTYQSFSNLSGILTNS